MTMLYEWMCKKCGGKGTITIQYRDDPWDISTPILQDEFVCGWCDGTGKECIDPLKYIDIPGFE